MMALITTEQLWLPVCLINSSFRCLGERALREAEKFLKTSSILIFLKL